MRARFVLALVLIAATSFPASASKRRAVSPKTSVPVYRTAFVRWSAASGGFATWEHAGTRLNAAGELELDALTASSETDPYGAGGYFGRSFYNGASYMVGEATSPVSVPTFTIVGAFATWNARTPPGTWVEVLRRVRVDGVWRAWYNWGVWDDDNSDVLRHSWREPDSNEVEGDGVTAAAVDGLQLKVRLFSANGVALPTVRNAGVTSASAVVIPPVLLPGDPSKWNRLLDVPQCSQMVYPDGGTVWCSPTSTSMVLAYLMDDAGPCEPGVRAATAGTHDWILEGYGNWRFNAAYASTFGLNAYATRFASMREIETWVELGIPVVINFAWNRGELTGAAIASSSGHLAVIIGFDAGGNPVVNDPAAPNDSTVRRTYLRSELEKLWLERGGGAVYLIYPEGFGTPPGH